jgi:hypothetical protein
MLAALRATLIKTLDPQEYEALLAQGAALEITDAVTYLRATADPRLRLP